MDGKKVVLVNTVYGSGSVGRITADLYHTLRQNGAAAAAAYGRGSAPEDIHAYKIGSRTDFYRHVCYNFYKDGSGFGSAKRTDRLLDWLNKERPDLLHLHNLHGFYVQIEKLFAYIKEKKIPVVWTLHDCWPFTGHCAYYDKNDCRKWKDGCGSCSYHRSSYPYAVFCDNSAENFQRKRAAFSGVENLTIVTPSLWLAGEAGSSFLGEYPVRVIPNGIDLARFCPDEEKPCNNKGAHQKWELLGAANVWEERKGLHFLEDVADRMPQDWHLTLIGLQERQIRHFSRRFSQERVSVRGRTDSVEELAAAYRKADVFLNPTLEDVFSMTNLEALACGTPVVTFPTGGSPETLEKSCGIVTDLKSADKLLAAADKIRREKAPEGIYSVQACRKWALGFGKEARYGEYLALYRDMINKG